MYLPLFFEKYYSNDRFIELTKLDVWQDICGRIPKLIMRNTNSLENFVSVTFNKLGLNWKDHVLENIDLIRPNELLVNKADPSTIVTPKLQLKRSKSKKLQIKP